MGTVATGPTRSRRLLGGALAALLAACMLVAPAGASADTRPPSGTPATVSSDSLPTVQINGIVWSQVIVGNTVYAGGSFSTAQPAGAAAGVNTVARGNLLAYRLDTGALITSFAPMLNGQVRGLAASPDGSRVYAVGEFTSVSGTTRNRIAAFSTATGALVPSFAPSANARVSSVAATNSTVYFGGTLTSVSGVSRPGRAAAVSASTGAVQQWAPRANTEGRVGAMTINPDGTKLVLGGNFTTMNGSSNPGYGLAAVDSITGASLPWSVNSIIRNAGPDAAITNLSSDGTSVYGTGYVFGGGGNFEGAFRADWSDGRLVWMEDCHGDSYSVHTVRDVTYVAGHPHYCGNVNGGFEQTAPWSFYRGIAVTNYATGVLEREPHGYFNFEGRPSPTLLHFYPAFNTGSVSGASQGPWSVTGSGNYVVFGGEFTTVNGNRQQGLARFTTAAGAPNDDGPRLSGSNWVPNVVSLAQDSVRVGWRANFDRDNAMLSYRVIRDGATSSPIHEVQASSAPWDRPSMSYLDTGVRNGETHTYRLRVEDPFGNVAWSNTVSVTVNGSGTVSSYASRVLADRPESYWRLGEGSGTTVYDWAGYTNAAASSGVTRGTSGAIVNDANRASTFSGTSSGFVSTGGAVEPTTNSFALEAWFRTTTTSGGKIVGYGNSSTGSSTTYDRHIYMDNTGRVFFGVHPGSQRTLSTAAGLNDGQWHHVVANLGPTGMQLHLDGVRVAQRTDTTTGQAYNGYWRIGGDTSWAGTSGYFRGDIDDVAVYRAALSDSQVAAHWSLSGRSGSTPPPPPPPDPQVLASDRFDRSVTGGLGTADAGGAWTLGSSASSYSVSGGIARLSTPPGAVRSGYLQNVSAIGSDVRATVSMLQPATGGGSYLSLLARKNAAGEYIGKVKVLSTGAVSIQVTRGGTSLHYASVPGIRYTTGDRLMIRVQAVGSAPTTIRAKVWAQGTTEPAGWQVSATDSTAGLQQAGYVGLRGDQTSTSTGTVVFAFDDFVAVRG
ncbi:LamG domain-containing protein [Planctomonas psychrotolerans]|uniref:LamG domain-containing protein n=1 Tax=Planctomonas psychrotolerans TaxID=2528712 RepID=UPI0012391B35|nr:LamG domain-containing protein [Planctomonas psychrotolerans]